MAVNGFVLINVQAGKELDVQKALSKIAGLTERYTIHHDFDFMVIANAEDSASLERFVTGVIKPIPGIDGIKTILGIAVGSAASVRTNFKVSRVEGGRLRI
jgi:DNA-binding Lrp family transcriptional regulator